MVASTANDDSFRHFGNWVKELEILDKDNLFWGYHLQEGYEKRVELCRYAPKESSPKRKAQKEVWKDLIEQVVQEVVG